LLRRGDAVDPATLLLGRSEGEAELLLPIQDAAACREALARLPELDLAELRQQWRALYKSDASPHLSRELLLRVVAYRMQEIVLGGLRPGQQRQLRQFARQLTQNREERIRPRPELKLGTRLVREWQGRTYEVLGAVRLQPEEERSRPRRAGDLSCNRGQRAIARALP
jgi:hypothetical protein